MFSSKLRSVLIWILLLSLVLFSSCALPSQTSQIHLLSETTKILSKEVIRLDLDPSVAYNAYERFAFRTAWIESEWRLDAANPNSTAKGVYQFTDPSLRTALRRLSVYYNNKPDWIISVERSGDITKMTADQQTALFFANLFQRKGTDPYLVLISQNNIWAMKQVYAKFHHTAPDEATEERMLKYYR